MGLHGPHTGGSKWSRGKTAQKLGARRQD